MDALDQLERIAKGRNWLLRYTYDTTSSFPRWQLDFGPHDNTSGQHHIREALLEDCAELMLNHIVRVGLRSMAGERG